MDTVHIRMMIRRDLPSVVGIEHQCFDEPWSEETFCNYLRQRNCIGRVAEDEDGRVVGFSVYELHKTRLHLLNFAVRKEFQRFGIGRRMVSELQRKLSVDRRHSMMLEVCEGNLAGHLFFRSLGFKAVQVIRGFYDNTDQDAYLFRYDVNQSETVERMLEAVR